MYPQPPVTTTRPALHTDLRPRARRQQMADAPSIATDAPAPKARPGKTRIRCQVNTGYTQCHDTNFGNLAQCPKKMEMWDLSHQNDPHGPNPCSFQNSLEKHNDNTSSSPAVLRFAFHLWICRSSSFRFGKCRLPDLTLPAPALSIFASQPPLL